MTKLDVLTYQPKPSDRFFFDNNIWMYLFCPYNGTNQKKFVDGYSGFLGKVLDANSKVFVSSLVLAEFYNAYIQIDYRLIKGGNEDFKFKRDYRPSNRFHETHETIMNTIESQILGIADRIDDNFSKISVGNLREGAENMDFNDSYYLELKRFFPFKLVTNDSDLIKTKMDIEILTML
jgi:predicted nucleic acid-binding protein